VNRLASPPSRRFGPDIVYALPEFNTPQNDETGFMMKEPAARFFVYPARGTTRPVDPPYGRGL